MGSGGAGNAWAKLHTVDAQVTMATRARRRLKLNRDIDLSGQIDAMTARSMTVEPMLERTLQLVAPSR